MVDIAIIGAGPAGLSCALYALRAGRSVLIFEKDRPGGQMLLAHLIENYPGVPEISGEELAQELLGQVTAAGGEIIFGEAVLNRSHDEYREIICGGRRYEAKSVVIAVGSRHRMLNVPGEREHIGRGVSYCALCDGALYAGRDVAVAGGGNSALSEALELSRICCSVTVIERMNALTAEAVLVDRCREKINIKILTGCKICDIISSTGNTLSIGVFSEAEGRRDITVDGLFVAVGRIPDTGAFISLADADGDGYIYAGENCAASEEGIFAAGDCRLKPLRQIATACADGITAAKRAGEYADRLSRIAAHR